MALRVEISKAYEGDVLVAYEKGATFGRFELPATTGLREYVAWVKDGQELFELHAIDDPTAMEYLFEKFLPGAILRVAERVVTYRVLSDRPDLA